jgi:hypothetical protein
MIAKGVRFNAEKKCGILLNDNVLSWKISFDEGLVVPDEMSLVPVPDFCENRPGKLLIYLRRRGLSYRIIEYFMISWAQNTPQT